MRRSLLVLTLVAGTVLLLDTLAWAPPLYGLRLTPQRGSPAVVRSLNAGSALTDPTARQRQLTDAVAGETLEAPNSYYDFDNTRIEDQQNPTREAVEDRCTPGNRIVLSSDRVVDPPEGTADDALEAAVVATIQRPEAGESSPRFDLSLPIRANADGEYYLLVRCVDAQDLRAEGVTGTPGPDELRQLGRMLDTRTAQTSGPFEPFNAFGTNLYVYPPEEAPPGAGQLPMTGGPLGYEVVVAAGLLAAGFALLAAGRRPRSTAVPDGTPTRWRPSPTRRPATARLRSTPPAPDPQTDRAGSY
jgi:hypothetical protein